MASCQRRRAGVQPNQLIRRIIVQPPPTRSQCAGAELDHQTGNADAPHVALVPSEVANLALLGRRGARLVARRPLASAPLTCARTAVVSRSNSTSAGGDIGETITNCLLDQWVGLLALSIFGSPNGAFSLAASSSSGPSSAHSTIVIGSSSVSATNDSGMSMSTNNSAGTALGCDVNRLLVLAMTRMPQ